jgi:UPF0755 protein
MFQKSLSAILIGLLVIVGYSLYAIFVPITVPEGQIFEIEKGEKFISIAGKLDRQEYVHSKSIFSIYALFSGASKKIQAGKYEFSGDMTMGEVLKKMKEGEVVATDQEIKIIEGWSIDDIASFLKKEGFAESRQEILTTLYDFSRWEALIGESSTFLRETLQGRDSPEGFLFPDTYRIDFDAKPEDIFSLMLSTFSKKINPYLPIIEKQGKTLFQVITMASLIEKEVPETKDRKIVSGILWKRFLANYPLQVDATITYLTGKNSTAITQDDLWIDSKYNTYRNSGLPPGPISNPGIDAIEAALYQEKSPYWFYLSAPDGTTIFSKTFEEHKRAKAKYLQGG